MDKEADAIETIETIGSIETIDPIDTAVDGPSFGGYLTTLLSERHLTPRDLAVLLELDLSLVYKWLRGERTPRFNSGHADSIAEALHLPPTERHTLFQSQVRSLRERPAQRSRPAPRSRFASAPVASSVASLIDRRMIPHTGRAPTPRSVKGSTMTPADGAVRGPRAALAAAIEILATAPSPRSLEQTIHLTWQGEGALDPFNPPFGTDWVYEMRGALARGWKVQQIWRLNRDISRSVTLVQTMLDLVGAGAYESFFIPKHEALQTPYDLLIVPDHAAALFFATADGSTVDSALVTHDPAQIALLSAHFDLLGKHAQPLIEAYPRRMVGLFDKVLVESEMRVPGRLFVKYSPSLMTEPAEWSSETSFWTERMREMGFAGTALTHRIESRRERLMALLAHAETTDYRDICTMQSIQDIAQRGWYLRNAEARPTKGATVAERRQHLQNAIDVLRRYPHFQLGLLDDGAAEELRVTRETQWEILGAQRVLINARSLDSDDQPVDLDITLDEPGIVAAFVEHFESHWRRIAPQHRDKEWVIKWLDEQLRDIPDAD
jgi:transcriptional regulator with XRE-family HTH domain